MIRDLIVISLTLTFIIIFDMVWILLGTSLAALLVVLTAGRVYSFMLRQICFFLGFKYTDPSKVVSQTQVPKMNVPKVPAPKVNVQNRNAPNRHAPTFTPSNVKSHMMTSNRPPIPKPGATTFQTPPPPRPQSSNASGGSTIKPLPFTKPNNPKPWMKK